jgi:hypothetical protein
MLEFLLHWLKERNNRGNDAFIKIKHSTRIVAAARELYLWELDEKQGAQ